MCTLWAHLQCDITQDFQRVPLRVKCSVFSLRCTPLSQPWRLHTDTRSLFTPAQLNNLQQAPNVDDERALVRQQVIERTQAALQAAVEGHRAFQVRPAG